MKNRNLFTAVALTIAAASGPVLAQEASYDYPQVVSSQTTRAAVLDALKQARADGSAQVTEAGVGQEVRVLATRSRPAVQAEAQLASRSGAIQALTAEPQGFTVQLPQGPAALTVAVR